MKEEKNEKIVPEEVLEKLKKQGIPVSKSWFKQTVRNENHFGIHETMPTRQAKMTLTPMGLLVEQKGKKPALIPTSNLIWCDL